MTEKSFKKLEQQGWLEKAQFYDNSFAQLTRTAIPPILATFGDLENKSFLEVACGTGHLAGKAATVGAKSEGIDFAGTMIEIASKNYPFVSFREGDAEDLPYEDNRFDAVACSFGVLHFARPEQAFAEAARVLKVNGRYTFTAWCSADQGGDFFKLVMGAVSQYGNLDTGLPPAPPLFRFADPIECQTSLSANGFRDITTEIIPLQWQTDDPQDILDMIYKSIVRTPMILMAQAPEAREQIHSAIIEGTETFRQSGGITLKFPALLTTAVKV